MRRREFIQTGGIALATTVATAGCSVASSAQGNELQSQLDTVRTATEKYQDPKKALQDGFKPGGPYVPGMGWHFTHPKRGKRAAKDGIDIEKPNVLTYLETDEGLQLGAAEYAVPAKAVEETPDLFADDGADATEKWHEHEAATHVFALPDGERTSPEQVSFDQWTTNDHWAEFRPVDEDLSAGDTASLNWGSAKATEGERTERVVDLVTNHPTLTTLHVWVHTENPEGVFKPVNSKFAEGGHHGDEGHHDD